MKDYQDLMVRFPKEVHEKLRYEAFITKKSMNEIVRLAVDAYYKDKENKQAK